MFFGLDFDYDSSETFKANNPDAVFINDDIRSVDVADISQLVETAKKRCKDSVLRVRSMPTFFKAKSE
ncbi:hypothetical protein LNN77_10050 [Klebsiella pneumoniae subsp. pneumoniae]|nr:hypothetical protein [Klebsiella pneumoniae subsp. pneumoniae]